MNKNLKSFFGYWLIPCFISLFIDLITIESFSKINLRAYVLVVILYFIVSFNLNFISKIIDIKYKNKLKSILLVLLINFIISFVFVFLYWIAFFIDSDYNTNYLMLNIYQSILSTAFLLFLILVKNIHVNEFNLQFKYNFSINVKLYLISFLILTLIHFLQIQAIYNELTTREYLIRLFEDIFIICIWSLLIHTLLFLFDNINLKKKLLYTYIISNFFSILFVIMKTNSFSVFLLKGLFIDIPFLAINVSVFYFYKIINQNKKLKFEKLQLNQEYLNLKNQINPHFLFNNLNTLIGFIEENPKKAIDFGHLLSDVYRHFLKTNNDNFVSLNSELSFIKSYLGVYKTKFFQNINFIIDLEISENEYILSNALQELIDNIFKHNHFDELSIEIKRTNEYLIIKNTINQSNNIKSSTKKGLININKRYELLTNKSIIKSESKEYFEIQIPILNYED